MLSPEDLSSSLSGFIQEPLPISNPIPNPISGPATAKRKRSLPGTPGKSVPSVDLSIYIYVCHVCGVCPSIYPFLYHRISVKFNVGQI